MGITIHYRGRIDDLSRIEEFVNSIVNAIFALGGKPTIWRSYAEGNPKRIIRGVIAHIAEGVDALSLLVAPEGDLVPLFDIERAEQQAFPEPPWCFVKTQFGSPISHASIALLLDAIQKHFASNLEVRDEGGYYEHRDFAKFVKQQQLNDGLIAQFSSAIATHGQMSREAVEDPNIIALRIERIAMLVQANLIRKAESSDEPRYLTDDDLPDDPSLEDEVAWYERRRRKDDLSYQMFRRRLGEALAAGKTPEEAFAEDYDVELPLADESEHRGWSDDDVPEPWVASLNDDMSFRESEFEQESERSRHPAVELATELIVRLFKLKTAPRTEGPAAGNFLEIAFSGAADCSGGLVQATSMPEVRREFRALAISQLRRSLSGHAFLRGAVFALHSENVITKQEADEMHDILTEVLEHIHQLSAAAWEVEG